MRRSFLIAALAAVAASSAGAQQQTVAGWKVGPIGGGCAMVRPQDKEGGPAVMVQMSEKKESRVVFILPGSKIEPGFTYTGLVGWDDMMFPVHFPAAGDAAAPGLLMEAPDDRLVSAVARNDEVRIAALLMTDALVFPLTGAKEAAAALRTCLGTPKK
jgi:hypothetical protein